MWLAGCPLRARAQLHRRARRRTSAPRTPIGQRVALASVGAPRAPPRPRAFVPRLCSVPMWPPSPLRARAHVPRQKLSPRGREAGSQRKYEGRPRRVARAARGSHTRASGGRGACGRVRAPAVREETGRARAPERRLVFLITGRSYLGFLVSPGDTECTVRVLHVRTIRL